MWQKHNFCVIMSQREVSYYLVGGSSTHIHTHTLSSGELDLQHAQIHSMDFPQNTRTVTPKARRISLQKQHISEGGLCSQEQESVQASLTHIWQQTPNHWRSIQKKSKQELA